VKILVLLSALFITSVSVSQNKKLDSLYQVLKKSTKQDTNRINTMIAICYYEHTSHPEKSKEMAEEILSQSKNIHFIRGEGYGHRYMALYHWIKGNYEEGVKEGFKMLSVFERASNEIGMAKSYMVLGLLSEELRDFDQSKKYFLKALDINERRKLAYDIGYNLNSLGALHSSFLKYDEAEKYYLRSLAIRKKIADEEGMSQSYSNLAGVERERKNYTKALGYLQQTLMIGKKYNNKNRMAVAYMGIGKINGLIGKYDEGEHLLQQGLAIAKQLNGKERIRAIYSELAALEEKRKNYKAALGFTKLQDEYEDSLFTEHRTEQIAELEVRYETEKKEQAIALLERDKKIETLWKNISVAGLFIVVSVSFTGLLFFRYRERKNRNLFNLQIDYLTEQNKEIAIKYQQTITDVKGNNVEPQEQRLMKKVLVIVEKYIADPTFGVERMAEEMSMSRASLNRKLKEASRYSPSDFIRLIRLKRAASMIAGQVDTITQIGLAVGFNDHSYFSKSFRKQFGVSPSEYLSSIEKNEPIEVSWSI
jgi:AraC-like DNA-binding protein